MLPIRREKREIEKGLDTAIQLRVCASRAEAMRKLTSPGQQISWSGPCCPVFLGPDGGDGKTHGDPRGRDRWNSGRGPQGSGHPFVEAARPDTPLVFLRPSSLLGADEHHRPKDDRRRQRKTLCQVARTVTGPGAAFLTFETRQLAAALTDSFLFSLFFSFSFSFSLSQLTLRTSFHFQQGSLVSSVC